MQEIAYAVVDGYLIIASSRLKLAESARLHRSGESLAKSSKFQASLPTGNQAEMSALVYENPLLMAGITLRQASPELADLLAKSTADAPPVVMAGYADETALREASRSSGMDAGAMMVVAAIAIPNLLRARIAANESSAVMTVRTANVAQITYQSTYPQKGYAHDLASLGPDPRGPNLISAQHASLIDAALGDATCTSGAWCTKSGYRFTIATKCKAQPCMEYVVVATPVSSGSGSKNFCSTSDAVLRSQTASPLESAVSVAECQRWAPIQ
jgi:type II secretory pathway pseudopilin PulG